MALTLDDLGLPRLEQNPFSIRTLSAQDHALFVGRIHILTKLKQYILRKSDRHVILVGPYGSGRSSLARMLESISSLSAYIDHLSSEHSGISMLQSIYTQFLGLEPPQSRVELSEKLVNLQNISERNPLIVLDVQAGDDSQLHVALRDALPVLERMKALVLMIADQRQQQQLPQEISQHFDEVMPMESFTPQDVIAMVSSRLRNIGHMNFTLQKNVAERILLETDGLPRGVLQFLRDKVDEQIFGEDYELTYPVQNEPYAAFSQPRDEPNLLHRIVEKEERGGIIEQPSTQHQQHDDHQPEIIDASIPWNERNDLNEAFDSSLFELDLDNLHQEMADDEPLLESPTVGILEQENYFEATPSFSGPFKSLRKRNFDAKEPEIPLSEEVILKSDGEVEFSMHTSPSFEPSVDETHLDSGAHLIHDEIGIEEAPAIAPIDVQNQQSSPDMLQHVLELLSSVINENNGTGIGSLPPHVVSMMMKNNSPRIGQRNEYPLNAVALQQLNTSEVFVVSIASNRMYSPSDEEMLEHLKIKRSRLSQISNRLLKFGILSSRMHGRKCMYSLTSAARNQLLAWSTLPGGSTA